MQHLPMCLLQYIFDMLKTKDQINFRKTNKKHYNLSIKRIKLNKIDFIDNFILSQPVFTKLEYINLNNCKKMLITDFNDLKHLHTLVLKRPIITAINPDCLQNINLKKLTLTGVTNKIQINHMTNLKKLCVQGFNIIVNEDIQNINVKKLDISFTDYITNFNHMSNLKTLRCYGCYNINSEKLIGLKLTKLCLGYGTPVINLNFMTCLKSLVLRDYFINDTYIKDLNLEELHIENTLITNISHMTNLKRLSCPGRRCLLKQEYIPTQNLQFLNISDNPNIREVVLKMPNLTYLNCSGHNSSIDNDIIDRLNLRVLKTSFNKKISQISHMTNLKILECKGESGITNNSIKGLNIQKINSIHNNNITNVISLKHLSVIYCSQTIKKNKNTKAINISKYRAFIMQDIDFINSFSF